MSINMIPENTVNTHSIEYNHGRRIVRSEIWYKIGTLTSDPNLAENVVKHTETDGILFMDILRKSRIFDIFAIISYTVHYMEIGRLCGIILPKSIFMCPCRE